ncbi:hypothetical protein K466DRAFT_497240, partial [Polyporus arcularius HHB13444]
KLRCERVTENEGKHVSLPEVHRRWDTTIDRRSCAKYLPRTLGAQGGSGCQYLGQDTGAAGRGHLPRKWETDGELSMSIRQGRWREYLRVFS